MSATEQCVCDFPEHGHALTCPLRDPATKPTTDPRAWVVMLFVLAGSVVLIAAFWVPSLVAPGLALHIAALWLEVGRLWRAHAEAFRMVADAHRAHRELVTIVRDALAAMRRSR